jgi:hypothetical protein
MEVTMADYEFPLQAVQLGSNLAQQGFQRDLQRRQFAGQEADRALRARVAAQEMELNALKIDEYSNKVAMEAKRRAMLEVALDGFEKEMSIIGGSKPSTMREVAPVADAASTTPPRFPLDVGIGLDLLAPRGPGPAPMAIPERLQGSLGVGDITEIAPAPRPEIGEAFLKHFGPVAALTGSNLDDVIRAATTLERQRGEGALLKQKAAADIKRIESTTKVNEARVKQIEEGKAQKQPETLILLDAYDRAESEGEKQCAAGFGQGQAKRRAGCY